MYKCFLKPVWKIFFIYILGGVSVAADVAQLTNFNLMDFLKNYAPLSYYLLIFGTVVLYFALVVYEIIRDKPTQQSSTQGTNDGQIIRTGNVMNSTIIQVKKDKEG